MKDNDSVRPSRGCTCIYFNVSIPERLFAVIHRNTLGQTNRLTGDCIFKPIDLLIDYLIDWGSQLSRIALTDG